MSSDASSRGSVSDHFRSRTSSDSSDRTSSVDRFRANSFDDELESNLSPRRRDSPRSSDAGSSILATELQRRESSSQRDLVGATSIVPFIPCLQDEDIGDVKFDDPEVEPELAEMPFGVPGPSPYHVDFLGPTRTRVETLAYTLHYCDAPSSIEARVPTPSEGPWSAPAGFLCVYESFFTECDLTFPIPGFLLEYVTRQEMALSQLFVTSIRNAIGLVRLASRCGMVVHLSHYEETTKIKSLSKKKSGLHYVQSSTTPKLVNEAKSKTNDWSAGYFFVRISAKSVEDIRIPIYTGWKILPAHFPTIFDPFPEQLKKDLDKIRAEGRKTMGKFNLDVIPNYTSRHREKRPATEDPAPKPSRSEEQDVREVLKKSLLDRGGRHASQAGTRGHSAPTPRGRRRMKYSRLGWPNRQVGSTRLGSILREAVLWPWLPVAARWSLRLRRGLLILRLARLLRRGPVAQKSCEAAFAMNRMDLAIGTIAFQFDFLAPVDGDVCNPSGERGLLSLLEYAVELWSRASGAIAFALRLVCKRLISSMENACAAARDASRASVRASCRPRWSRMFWSSLFDSAGGGAAAFCSARVSSRFVGRRLLGEVGFLVGGILGGIGVTVSPPMEDALSSRTPVLVPWFPSVAIFAASGRFYDELDAVFRAEWDLRVGHALTVFSGFTLGFDDVADLQGGEVVWALPLLGLRPASETGFLS
ncbi:hypothetical protein ISN45_Aa07g028410 [Arabidopsis thaliana x Arabidopsis arenosa]|uniref:Uncharacterized protein n=1 Tax=Arabidopsis thaliana x Arabidopsis arenosa TaxID=1240361 RepID=A0A8T1Y9I2_9BRAS|nr:hypothetical protein ISN45_Aa07g028410 [Arabidopsis thaliana x Arabidopsis arenosa]